MTRHAIAASLLLTLAGCSEKITQVVVTIDAESAWRAQTSTVRVVVRGGAPGDGGFDTPSRDVTLIVGDGETYTFPIDVTVAPLGGDASRRWSVDATAVNGTTNATATVRVRGTYVSGRTLRVALVLENTCAGIVCLDTQTCRAGACVDATFANPNDAGVDGGNEDGGTDDGGVPPFCPDPDIRIPNAADGTLNDPLPPVYPPLPDACPLNHDPGEACHLTANPDDVCFSARAQGNTAFCRTPCSLDDGDGGVRADDPVCAAIHPDSRCTEVQGSGSDPDSLFCSTPCNPFDDVGCPQGLHCMAIADTGRSTFYGECLALDENPRHYLEPCAIVDGDTYPSPTGCAPGYTCGFDSVCEAPGTNGYVCLQICDPDEVAPRVTCPTGSECYRLVEGTYDDAIGPIRIGRCGPF